MHQYLDLIKKVLKEGVHKEDRTGTGTISIFSHEMRFNLQEGFPLVTTKKLHLKSIIHELLWFISGDTNIKYLKDNGVTIWDEWADENGDLGPVYGKQWRHWPGHVIDKSYTIDDLNYFQYDYESIDQINNLINSLKNNPDSRRHIVSSWNPLDIPDMALPPCHCFFQCYVINNRLSLKLTQRSADVFLGVPFNIASYALLTHMLAQVCGYEVGEFIWSGGDIHLYSNHIEQAKLQIQREPKPLPKLIINSSVTDIDAFVFEDFHIEGYESWPSIYGKVAV